MIPILVVAFALAVMGPPLPKIHNKPPCPADTVFIRLHYHEDNLFPYVVVDTVRTRDAHEAK